jgi:hypothetical protein
MMAMGTGTRHQGKIKVAVSSIPRGTLHIIVMLTISLMELQRLPIRTGLRNTITAPIHAQLTQQL